LIRAPLSTTAVLDESADLVRATAARWAGVLLLTSLPYYFLQAVFLDRIFELGSKATEYGDLLRSTAYLTVLAFALSLWGRAVYARACRLAATRGEAVGCEALRVPGPALVNYIYLASLAELTLWLTMFTLFGPIVAVMIGGLAIGTMELNEEPGLRAPFRVLGRYGRVLRIQTGLLLVFFVAFLVALANITAAFEIGFWLVSSIGGWDIPKWTVLLSGANRRYVLMLIAGAVLAIQPFWIAANVMLIRKAGVQETGDDLRVWFEELQRTS
jgi:hypothetical protein